MGCLVYASNAAKKKKKKEENGYDAVNLVMLSASILLRVTIRGFCVDLLCSERACLLFYSVIYSQFITIESMVERMSDRTVLCSSQNMSGTHTHTHT